MGIFSNGSLYGIPENIIYSMPVTINVSLTCCDKLNAIVAANCVKSSSLLVVCDFSFFIEFAYCLLSLL